MSTTVREQQVEVGVTPDGKVLQQVRNNNSGLLTIQFTSGGELPAELSGGFTDANALQRAVNTYLATKIEAKEKTAEIKRKKRYKKYLENYREKSLSNKTFIKELNEKYGSIITN